MVRRKYPEAIANYKKMLSLYGDHTGVKCYLGFSLAKAGKMEEANAIRMELESGRDYVSPIEIAIVYMGLGEKDKAILMLERAYSERDFQMQYLGTTRILTVYVLIRVLLN